LKGTSTDDLQINYSVSAKPGSLRTIGAAEPDVLRHWYHNSMIGIQALHQYRHEASGDAEKGISWRCPSSLTQQHCSRPIVLETISSGLTEFIVFIRSRGQIRLLALNLTIRQTTTCGMWYCASVSKRVAGMHKTVERAEDKAATSQQRRIIGFALYVSRRMSRNSANLCRVAKEESEWRACRYHDQAYLC
jgi:hypothetical protein